jgi:signal transduction histidine kinase
MDFNEHAQKLPEERLPLLSHINEAVTDKKLIQIEDHYLNSKEEEVFVLRSILPHYTEGGELENVIVIGIDITELKSAQDALIANNQELKKINLELDNFVYSISHDLRSPLLSIKGIISLIRHQGNIDEQSRKFLDLADTSVVRLDNTIQEILEYSRNSRLDIVNEEFAIDDLIQNVFDDLKFSVSEEISLNLHHQGGALVYADRARINILLKNILGNSVKYRRTDVQSEIHVDVHVTESEIELDVTDNGQGIAEEHVEKVFNMFYRATTSSVGTGLGLYICHEIITKLGGKIQLDSKLGAGTRVKMIIPLTA